jgi:hypothetical protein
MDMLLKPSPTFVAGIALEQDLVQVFDGKLVRVHFDDARGRLWRLLVPSYSIVGLRHRDGATSHTTTPAGH